MIPFFVLPLLSEPADVPVPVISNRTRRSVVLTLGSPESPAAASASAFDMPVATPREGYDYKLLVTHPDPAIDYKLIVNQATATPHRLKRVEQR